MVKVITIDYYRKLALIYYCYISFIVVSAYLGIVFICSAPGESLTVKFWFNKNYCVYYIENIIRLGFKDIGQILFELNKIICIAI